MPVALSAASAAMHGAMVPIASQVGTSSGVEITFNNIPQVYQDLRLVINALPSNSATVAGIYFNNTVATTFSTTVLIGNGSSASSLRNTAQFTYVPGGFNTISTSNPSSITVDILNYANTTTFKTLIGRMASDQNGSGYTTLSVGMRNLTDAIQSLSLSTLSGSFYWTANTTATLYGIRSIGQ